MVANQASGVSVDVFIGSIVTSELRMHLNYSKQWKRAIGEQKELQLIHYQGEEYFGIFVGNGPLKLEDLHVGAAQVKKLLSTYFPELQLDNLILQIFPQIFIK